MRPVCDRALQERVVSVFVFPAPRTQALAGAARSAGSSGPALPLGGDRTIKLLDHAGTCLEKGNGGGGGRRGGQEGGGEGRIRRGAAKRRQRGTPSH